MRRRYVAQVIVACALVLCCTHCTPGLIYKMQSKNFTLAALKEGRLAVLPAGSQIPPKVCSEGEVAGLQQVLSKTIQEYRGFIQQVPIAQVNGAPQDAESPLLSGFTSGGSLDLALARKAAEDLKARFLVLTRLETIEVSRSVAETKLVEDKVDKIRFDRVTHATLGVRVVVYDSQFDETAFEGYQEAGAFTTKEGTAVTASNTEAVDVARDAASDGAFPAPETVTTMARFGFEDIVENWPEQE